jgi:hypothetical protein
VAEPFDRHALLARADPSSLEVWQDVTIEATGGGAYLVIGRSPGNVGELATLHVIGRGQTQKIRVRVTESRLGMVDGNVRHLLRLAEASDAADGLLGVALAPTVAPRSV